MGQKKNRTTAARREREKNQVLGTPIQRGARRRCRVRKSTSRRLCPRTKPPGQDERKGQAGTRGQKSACHGGDHFGSGTRRAGPSLMVKVLLHLLHSHALPTPRLLAVHKISLPISPAASLGILSGSQSGSSSFPHP